MSGALYRIRERAHPITPLSPSLQDDDSLQPPLEISLGTKLLFIPYLIVIEAPKEGVRFAFRFAVISAKNSAQYTYAAAVETGKLSLASIELASDVCKEIIPPIPTIVLKRTWSNLRVLTVESGRTILATTEVVCIISDEFFQISRSIVKPVFSSTYSALRETGSSILALASATEEAIPYRLAQTLFSQVIRAIGSVGVEGFRTILSGLECTEAAASAIQPAVSVPAAQTLRMTSSMLRESCNTAKTVLGAAEEVGADAFSSLSIPVKQTASMTVSLSGESGKTAKATITVSEEAILEAAAILRIVGYDLFSYFKSGCKELLKLAYQIPVLFEIFEQPVEVIITIGKISIGMGVSGVEELKKTSLAGISFSEDVLKSFYEAGTSIVEPCSKMLLSAAKETGKTALPALELLEESASLLQPIVCIAAKSLFESTKATFNETGSAALVALDTVDGGLSLLKPVICVPAQQAIDLTKSAGREGINTTATMLSATELAVGGCYSLSEIIVRSTLSNLRAIIDEGGDLGLETLEAIDNGTEVPREALSALASRVFDELKFAGTEALKTLLHSVEFAENILKPLLEQIITVIIQTVNMLGSTFNQIKILGILAKEEMPDFDLLIFTPLAFFFRDMEIQYLKLKIFYLNRRIEMKEAMAHFKAAFQEWLASRNKATP